MTTLTELIEKGHTLKGSGRFLKTIEHSSLVIDTAKDIFYWNSQGIIGDVFVWLTKVEGRTESEARQILKEDIIHDHQLYVEVVSPSGKELTVYPKLVDIFHEVGKTSRTYWYDRGFTDKTIDRFYLGYNEGWYLIPFFVNGTLLNFQMRRDTPEKRIKSWYSGVGPILFNSDILRMGNSVVITESPTDAMLLSQRGIPGVVSTNGGSSYWSPAWYKFFLDKRDIYIVYDNDKPGRKGATVIAKALGQNRCFVYNFDEYPEKYDLGDWLADPKNKVTPVGDFLEEKSRRIFE